MIGEECSVAADPADPHVLLVKYPESFPKSYITPHIKLEIGPLASWIPNDKFAIETFVGEASSTVRCWVTVAWMEQSTGRLVRSCWKNARRSMAAKQVKQRSQKDMSCRASM